MSFEDNQAIVHRRMSMGSAGVGVSQDATARAVAGMSIGAIKSWQEMRERVWQDALDEYDQQYQAQINIECGNTFVWMEKDIHFDLIFVDEPSRDSPYTTPLFTYGLELISGTPILITIMVKQWVRDVQGVRGCRLLIGAVSPGQDKLVQFIGKLHLNFQGYATKEPTEGEEDES
jgi:hypothetical protein